MTPTELRAEIDADPKALGYAAPFADGDDAGLARLLNAPAGAGAEAINRAAVGRGELLEVLAGVGGLSGIYSAAGSATDPRFDVAKAASLILENPDSTVDYTRAGTRALVAALGPGGTAILDAGGLAALQSVCTRTGSRAEVLWGEGAAVTPDDVAAARKVVS
jgi:hypothetical protein